MPSNAVRRIDAPLSSARSGDGEGSVDINVAVLDDGIQLDHPDLNAVRGTNCARGRGSPKYGEHGTMVGGFIGALDNSIGRVGVAPGAKLWDVQVLHPSSGGGSNSETICGLDFVTATRTDANPANDIAVANMSLGGPSTETAGCATTTDAFHLAHCRAVAAGVVLVVAAGNDEEDLATQEPANYEEVLTATAMADFDGQPGGLTPPFADCADLLRGAAEQDDTEAFFSNFATLAEDMAHTVAAPGVCVGSTFRGSQYAISAGTSFSAPLVAGTVALCIHAGPCAGLTPAQVIDKIVADAAAYNLANPGYGFDGDPLRPSAGRYYGHLIRAGLY